MGRRVVITGVGAVSPIGIGAQEMWASAKSGKCGISRIEGVDVSDMPTSVGAEIKDFDPVCFMDKKEVRKTDRFAQFALAAAQMAVESAQLNFDGIDRTRAGVIIGSGIGGIGTMEQQHAVLSEKGPRRVSPFFITMMIPNIASGLIAIRYGLKGFNECVVTACASSNNAIGDAFHRVRDNVADMIVTGGAEAPITQLALSGFCSNKAMTTNPDPLTASRPFDRERDGFVIGEGSGVLVLEELEHAIKRGVPIIAEIVGYGCNNDAYHIVNQPEGGAGAVECMKAALADAGVNPSDIGYINAHGTSTGVNDKNETAAVKTVFGEQAGRIPMSSTKSMTGHLLGASGSIETIMTAFALQQGYVPPTINYHNIDPACDLDYVPNNGRKLDFEYGMTNSFGFGGHNASLILRKWH